MVADDQRKSPPDVWRRSPSKDNAGLVGKNIEGRCFASSIGVLGATARDGPRLVGHDLAALADDRTFRRGRFIEEWNVGVEDCLFLPDRPVGATPWMPS